MQSGKIKHWNQDKGYGFIDVDNQNEDVFFHVSTVRLSQPISEGQRVYFNSQRNDKNLLPAPPIILNETASSINATRLKIIMLKRVVVIKRKKARSRLYLV